MAQNCPAFSSSQGDVDLKNRRIVDSVQGPNYQVVDRILNKAEIFDLRVDQPLDFRGDDENLTPDSRGANGSKGSIMVSVIFSDFFLWPYNLARDFPRRVGRLVGALAAWPDILERAPFIAWLYTVICYLFDLSGGPEILEFLLRSTTDTRPLNEAETAMATAIFGPKAIRYRDVRIAQRGILRQAFRLNKGRAFATWHTINLPDRRDENLPLLIHELTHVFQYERVGSVYIGQGLWAQYQLDRKAYDYGGPAGLADGRAAGKRYSDYNREQQGQITQDYCFLKLSGKNTAAYDPFIDELQAGAI